MSFIKVWQEGKSGKTEGKKERRCTMTHEEGLKERGGKLQFKQSLILTGSYSGASHESIKRDCFI